MTRNLRAMETVAMATAAMGLCVYAASINTGDVRKAESNAAQALYAERVMVGDENGNLNLEDTVTRAEFVMLMYKAGCFDAVEKERFSVDFSDLSNEHSERLSDSDRDGRAGATFADRHAGL